VNVDVKKEEYKSNLQSLNDLIANRRTLKNAIAMSNAMTKVTIDNKEYTIVEAIEEKHFAEQRQRILSTLKYQFNNATSKANAENEKLSESVERYLASMGYSEKNGRPVEDIKKMREDYIAQNTYELIDPNDLGKVIEEETKALDAFLSNIDFKLSESNATTIITVDLAAE
jgi:hypothetical protein